MGKGVPGTYANSIDPGQQADARSDKGLCHTMVNLQVAYDSVSGQRRPSLSAYAPNPHFHKARLQYSTIKTSQ